MPYTDNNGTRIWYEARGEGEAFVLLHGFTSSSAHWKVGGYVSALEKSHRVVLIDLRGHGKSAKPQAREAYTLSQRLSDIDAVLRELGIVRAHFCGFSMGGWLAYAMAVSQPQRVVSLIIGGAHPYDESFAPFAHLDGSDPDAFIHALEQFLGETISPAARRMMLLNDLRALCAAAIDRVSLEAEVMRIRVPLLMFVGDCDQRLAAVQRAVQAMQAKLVIVPDAGHTNTLDASSVLIREIKFFLNANAAG